jgi:threonine aldolase
MFGREAALYCPSGTMTNQIAVNVHTKPGDEVICDKLSHIYNYEGGGIAFNSGASVRLLNGDRGRFSAQDILDNINPDDPHFPVSKLVTVENTCNKGGGSYWDIKEIRGIRDVCLENNLKMHLDGARLFNALVETGDNMLDYGILFDSISICLSKGLGAPVGSVLIGDPDFIKQARRIRKVFGGGMRQAGFIAAAGIYALENNIDRLKEDHRRAKILGEILSSLPYVKEVMLVETNIVVAEIVDKFDSSVLFEELKAKGILVVGFGKQKIRMVTHLDFDDDMLEEFVGRL